MMKLVWYIVILLLAFFVGFLFSDAFGEDKSPHVNEFYIEESKDGTR